MDVLSGSFRAKPLVVRLRNWVGEAVLSLPALWRLEAAGYSLRLIGRGWARALFESQGWPLVAPPAPLTGSVHVLRELRRRLAAESPAFASWPRAMLLTSSFSSALATRLAGFRLTGYAADARSILLERAYASPRVDHVAHAYWHLVGLFLGEHKPFPSALRPLDPTPLQRRRAAERLASAGLSVGGFVVLCPFSGQSDRASTKVWPQFPELAWRLSSRGVKVLLCPGPGEERRARELFPGAIHFDGLDLGEYGGILRKAHTVVANDTGPGHLAAAVGARLVSVYGPASLACWAPLGPRVRLIHQSDEWPTLDAIRSAVLA